MAAVPSLTQRTNALTDASPRWFWCAEAMIGPLIYWILVASVLGYYLLTAATQYLPASQVSSVSAALSAYTCSTFCVTIALVSA